MQYSKLLSLRVIFPFLLITLLINGCSDDPVGPAGNWNWSSVGLGTSGNIHALIDMTAS